MRAVHSCFLFCLIFLRINSENEYTNEFAVEMDINAFEHNLNLSAHNIEIIRQVSSLGNVFHLKHNTPCLDHRCQRFFSKSIADLLRKHPSIDFVEEQFDLGVEQKLDLDFVFSDNDIDENDQEELYELSDDIGSRLIGNLREIEKKLSSNFSTDDWVNHYNPSFYPIDSIEADEKKSIDPKIIDLEYELSKDDLYYLKLVEERKKILKYIHFNDPEAKNLWQLNNYGQFSRINPGMDMNIYPVYLANYTGKGVVVTIIDDGIDTQSADIKGNYDPAASLDFNDPHNTLSNPRGANHNSKMPPDEAHGTQCASVVGGVANNHFCAHGVAFNVNLGGIRMLARKMVTDLLEAYSLTHNNQYIDIFSNSWGPKDSGSKTSPITYYVHKAFETGTAKGRGGKGSIFLFAAGNGGLNYDHCGADGLVNSPFTIAVTATNIYGLKPVYIEECAAISVTAAVGGYDYDQMYERYDPNPVLIASVINGKCTKHFLGTSAATPLVAGCIALGLEANPNLTWRDVQHLFTISSRIPNPKETVWQLNTAGFLYSHIYGFGLLDCSAFVYNALKWKSVGEKRSCIGGKTNEFEDLYIQQKKRTRLILQTTACESTERSIDSLEHVLIHTKIQHHCRGDLTIILSSPTGTRSFLLKNRKWDRNAKTITFSFLSLINWGENPKGIWYLDIIDSGKCKLKRTLNDRSGKIITAFLEFFGTKRSESAAYLNKKLIEDYFMKIKMKKPQKSYILNERQLYNLFNEQRKYFIQLRPPRRETSYQYDPEMKK